MDSLNNYEMYLYINNNSLSKELCSDIIMFFEKDLDKYEGHTSGGLNKHIKNTVDLQIHAIHQNNKPHWNKIRELLEKELNNNIKKYIKTINEYIDDGTQLNKYKVFHDFVSFDTIQIQRYKKLEGKYIYHNDFMSDWENKKYRVITFLWYLNCVEEGGETEFWSKYKIKPEPGKLIFFPSTWTYPHRGLMPISNDKYIITGWIYLHD